MKSLIDNALSPIFIENEEIFEFAASEDRTIVSVDTDFGTLLALGKSAKPSVAIFRRTSGKRPEEQAELLMNCLPDIREPLERESVVIIEETRLRIRSLPISG